ncbi:MAG: type II toxin-antitoxin system VapC family toxin [Nitrospirota bacterium]
MQYFFDTSAIVKLYHQEAGSDRVLPLYRDGEAIVISELSKVELLSTIHKKLRTGEITADTLAAVRDRFFADCAIRFVVVHVASFIVDAAMDILGAHGRINHLFSLDALQIATLSIVAEKDITFVCADKRLTTLVKTIGFPILEL